MKRMGEWASGRAGVVLLSVVLLAACNKSTAEQQTAGPDIATIEKRDLDVRAEASGLVEPIQTIEIKSKASGEVLAVNVETGQEVTRGTLLVSVDARDVRNALLQAEADLEVAKARGGTAAANLRRVTELRKTNVATEQELESGVLEEANARAQLVKARTNLELARERMNDVTIRAPLSGTVIEKTIEPGSIIASASGTFGGGTTLLKMADLSVVRVRAMVDQTDIGRVEPGQSARITVEAYPGRPFTGEVVKVEPQAVVEQNVTMFPVLIHLRNDDRLLKPGMNTEVEIEIAQKRDIVVVPNDAVVSMRDANTAGAALGISEGTMKASMEKLREEMRARFANSGAGAGAGARERGTGQQGERVGAGTRERGTGQSHAPALSPSRAPGAPGATGGRGFGGGRRGNTRTGLVFVPGASGPEPRMVTLGVNDWDYTEVINGLEPNDQVFLMTAARLQQQQKEMADRMRQRNNSMQGMRQSPQPGQQSGQGGR